MFICDFISFAKLCEVDLHTMYCDLEKRFSPSLILSCIILIPCVSPGEQILYPTFDCVTFFFRIEKLCFMLLMQKLG
jgi:hypothetical protein